MIAAPAASAGTTVATVGSTGCADTPALMWRIGCRLYFADDAGRFTDRGAIDGVVSELQQFADAVATDSACALRATIDVVDMGAALWPAANAQPDTLTPAADDESFRRSGDYDATFTRYPGNGAENYAGITSVSSAGYPWSAFPVDADGRSYAGDPPQDPWHLLLMHEWMHEIVSFYIPAEQGWPTNDVHGGAEHGFTQAPYVNEPYFAAMLQGTVPENGRTTGLLPQDYTIEGTPAHPRRRPFAYRQVTFDADNIGHYAAPADFDGTLTITVHQGWGDPATSPVLSASSLTGPSATWVWDNASTTGQVMICVELPAGGTARYRPYHSCDSWTVYPSIHRKPVVTATRCVVPRLVGYTIVRARGRLARAHCRLGAVHRRRGRGRIRIRIQSVTAGRRLKAGAAVGVTTGPPRVRRVRR
jgi:hypothetical protein